MKTEMPILAPVAGRVRSVLVTRQRPGRRRRAALVLEPTEAGARSRRPATAYGSTSLGAACTRPAGDHRAALETLRRLILGFDVEPAMRGGWSARLVTDCARRRRAPPRGGRAARALRRRPRTVRAPARRRTTPRGRNGRAPRSTSSPTCALSMRSAASLPAWFVERLRRALAHHGVTSLERSAALDESWLRIYRAHQRVHEQVPLVMRILERRLDAAPEERAEESGGSARSHDRARRRRAPGARRPGAGAALPLARSPALRAGAGGGLRRGRSARWRRSRTTARPGAQTTCAGSSTARSRSSGCSARASTPPRRRCGARCSRSWSDATTASATSSGSRCGTSTAGAVCSRRVRVRRSPHPSARHARGLGAARRRGPGARRADRRRPGRPRRRRRLLRLTARRASEDADAVAAAVRAVLDGGWLPAAAAPHRRRGRDRGARTRDRRRAPLHLPPRGGRIRRGARLPRPAPHDGQAAPPLAAAQLRDRAAAVGGGRLPLPRRRAREPEGRAPVRARRGARPDAGPRRRGPRRAAAAPRAHARRGARGHPAPPGAARRPSAASTGTASCSTSGRRSTLTADELDHMVRKLAPATAGLGLEKVVLRARIPDPASGELRDTVLQVTNPGGRGFAITALPARPRCPSGRSPSTRRRSCALRRLGLTYPYEIVADAHAARGDVQRISARRVRRARPRRRGTPRPRRAAARAGTRPTSSSASSAT